MRFSAVSPSTSTVMQAPEKIKFSVYCMVHVDFYCEFLLKKRIHQEKKSKAKERFFTPEELFWGMRGISILLSKGVVCC
jgi:hypothetical protein